jgi:hypothetical protein
MSLIFGVDYKPECASTRQRKDKLENRLPCEGSCLSDWHIDQSVVQAEFSFVNVFGSFIDRGPL